MHGTRSYRGGKPLINTDEEAMDNLNSSLTDGLSSKVTQLKHLAFDLDSEARDHLPLLDGISEEMESGRSRLGGSSGRLRNIGMTRGVSGRRLTCYVGFAFVTLLVFFYYVVIPHVLS